MKGIKKYKLLIKKLVSHGNVTYRVMTTLVDTVLHSKVSRRVNLKNSYQEEKKSLCIDGY